MSYPLLSMRLLKYLKCKKKKETNLCTGNMLKRNCNLFNFDRIIFIKIPIHKNIISLALLICCMFFFIVKMPYYPLQSI